MLRELKLSIISFTRQGAALSGKIKEALLKCDIQAVELYTKCRSASPDEKVHYVEQSIDAWSKEHFQKNEALLFIGAMGIAVRSIAPYIKDKLSDPPVLVMDEKGTFVIPVLSGHVGGANELAVLLSEVVEGTPILTTATDVNETFAVDVFARENHLSIMNRDGIARTSQKALEEKNITLCVQHFPCKEAVDILIADDPLLAAKAGIVLCPKRYALGIGCKKGKSYEEIEAHAQKVLDMADLGWNEIGVIASIDLKADEEGIRELSRRRRIPFVTFDAEILTEVEGDFSASAFVAGVTGVDNVCERAACAAAGTGARLMMKKQAANGVTAAIAVVRDLEDKHE